MKKIMKDHFQYSRKILMNEMGVSQIIVFGGCIVVACVFSIFCMEAVKYVATVIEVNEISDTVLKSGMIVNNGLTPGVQNLVVQQLMNKGLDATRITVTGSISPQPFGTIMQGSIVYSYNFPIFTQASGLIPLITVQPQDIPAKVAPVALGITR